MQVNDSVTEFHYKHYLDCFSKIELINSITDKAMRRCLDLDVKKYYGLIEYYEKNYPEFKTRVKPPKSETTESGKCE